MTPSSRLPHGASPQVSLAMNAIFSPFVDKVDDFLYGGTQFVVSAGRGTIQTGSGFPRT